MLAAHLGSLLPVVLRQSRVSRVWKKGVFWKRGLFGKVHFLEILENLEILEILEIPQTLENKGESNHFPEIFKRI